MYVCMYVCMDGWMDGWMDGCVYIYKSTYRNARMRHRCMCTWVRVGKSADPSVGLSAGPSVGR